MPPTFQVNPDGQVQVKRADGTEVGGAEAATLIAANKLAVGRLLTQHVAQAAVAHELRLTEHRFVGRIRRNIDKSAARPASTRPPEPFHDAGGAISRLFRRPAQGAREHFSALWKYRQHLADWEKRQTQQMAAAAQKQTAAVNVSDAQSIHTNLAIHTKLAAHLSSLRWAFPIQIALDTITNGEAVLKVQFPRGAVFPDFMPAIAADGCSAPPTQRPAYQQEEEASRYRIAASVRLAVECFAACPPVMAVKIIPLADKSEPAPFIYERHRWMVADLNLAEQRMPNPLHRQMLKASSL